MLINEYHYFAYVFLFLIIFAETGLVIAPFLPGDSLLFMAGSVSAQENAVLHIGWLLILLIMASFLGNLVNYYIGSFFGHKLIQHKRLIKPQYIEKTHIFYGKYGNNVIILSRFVPIIRTIAPFVAGLASMNYKKFMTLNLISALLWVGLLCSLGYLLGKISWVQNNLNIMIYMIVFLSCLPAIIAVMKERKKTGKLHI